MKFLREISPLLRTSDLETFSIYIDLVCQIDFGANVRRHLDLYVGIRKSDIGEPLSEAVDSVVRDL